MGFTLTKQQQEILKKLRETAQNKIRSEITEFYKNVETLQKRNEEIDPTFWEKLSFLPSVGYGLIKGGLDGIVGSVQAVNVIIAQYANDYAKIFDFSDDENIGEAFGSGARSWSYAQTNLVTTAVEGIIDFSVSTTANLGRALELGYDGLGGLYDSIGWSGMADSSRKIADVFDPKWAFGEDGIIAQNHENADFVRSYAIEGRAIAGHNAQQEVIDNQYFDVTKNYLQGSVGVQNWVEDNITGKVADSLLGKGNNKAQEIYGEKEWFQTLSGVSESMGNILAMWGISAIGAKAGLSQPQVKVLANGYFASSVFGNMYQDAINDGYNLNDAFTYATGHAMMETLVEQTGGFKPGANPLSIKKRIAEKGWMGIFKDAFAEGVEEVQSEYGGTGFQEYAGKIEQQDHGEFYKSAMFAFISGASSSFFLGLGRTAHFNMTANNTVKKFYEAFKENGLEKTKTELLNLVDRLNGKATYAYVSNAKGAQTTRFMDQEQKRKFIKENNLEHYINENDEGKFEAIELTEDIFKNRIGDKVIEDGKYAINENVRAVDLTDGGKVQVMEQTNLNQQGQQALEVANDMNIPIAVYDGNTADSGFYGKNGVLYINQNNLNDMNIEKTIVKHEMVHAIKENNPELYAQIKNEVEKLVKMEISSDGSIVFTYKNKAVEKLFKDNQVESRIANNMQEYKKEAIQPDELMALGVEEMTAYAVENMIDDGVINRVLTKQNRSLLSKVASFFAKDDSVDTFTNNKRLNYQVKKIKKAFEVGAKDTVQKRNSVGYVLQSKTKEKIRKQVMAKIQKAIENKEAKLEELRVSIEEFFKALTDVEMPPLKTAEDIAVAYVMLESEYQEMYELDTLTDEIELAYMKVKDIMNELEVVQKEEESVTEEGFNIIKKRKSLDPNFLADSVIRNEDGTLKVMYHGSPEIFEKFLDEYVGENTMAGNTGFGHFFTDVKKFAERFKDIFQEGLLQGKVYEVYLDIKKPILHPYHIWDNNKLSQKEKNHVIKNYLVEADIYDGFLEAINEWLLESSPYDTYIEEEHIEEFYLNMVADPSTDPYEFASFEKEGLIKNGYDGIYIHEGNKMGTIALDESDIHEKDDIVMATVAFSAEQVYVIEENNPDIVKKRKAIPDVISDKEKSKIKKVFSDNILDEFFTKNKKGRYVLKNNKVTDQSLRTNTVKLNGIQYRSSDFAVNAYNEFGDTNIPDDAIPEKLSNLSDAEKMLHEYLSTTRLSYVLYRKNDGYGGYSKSVMKIGNTIYGNETNVVFINLQYLNEQNVKETQKNVFEGFTKILDTFVHEHMHEIFKFNPNGAFDYAYEFAHVMFKPVFDKKGNIINVEPTATWKQFEKKHNGGFIYYFNKYYGSKNTHYKVKDILSMYKLLTNAKSKSLTDTQKSSINEITAQITGTIFSSQEVYKKVMKGKSNLTFVMFDIYRKVNEDSTVDLAIKKYLQDAFKKYETIFEQYIKKIEEKFPIKEKYTLEELNVFIREFTNGQFTTKGNLMKAYAREKADKKRGIASRTVDNIIYIASIFGEKVQKAVENYTLLEEEFKLLKNNIESVLNNKKTIDALVKIPTLSSTFKKIFNDINTRVRILDGTYRGKSANKYNTDELAWLDLKDRLEDFKDQYDILTPELIKMFNLPDKQAFNISIESLQKSIDMAINSILSFGFIDDLKMLKATLQVFKISGIDLANTKKINSGIFGSLLKMHKELRKSNIKNILFAMNRSIKNLERSLQAVKRFSQTKPNQEFTDVRGFIDDLYKAVQNNAFDLTQMQRETKTILIKIRNMIKKSVEVGNEFGKSAEYVTGDDTLRQEIEKEIKELKDDLIDNKLRVIYEQFALLFENKKFLTNEYDLKEYDGFTIQEIVKEFKENKIAVNLANILKEFTTEFETVFRDGMSLNAYAKLTHDQIQKLKDGKIKFNLKGLSGVVSQGMTPQEILQIYMGVTEGKMDFFQDFYREYVKSAYKQEEIVATFDRAYEAWMEKQGKKKIIANTMEEVEVKTGYLLEIDVDDLEGIKNKAREDVIERKKIIKLMKEEKRQLVIEKRKKNKKIKDLQALKKNHQRGTKKWNNYNAQQKAIMTAKNAVLKQIENIDGQISLVQEDIRLLDENLLIKQRLIEVGQDTKSTMTKGHIISLYLSIIREIEMHRLADAGNLDISPTDHFLFGNQIHLFDNALLERKGFKEAKDETRAFTIGVESRQELANYLYSLLNDSDIGIIQFAKSTFDTNYNFANEMYKKKYGVDLTRQDTYIPFKTKDADQSREFNLKRVNRNNLGVDKGFILKTTIGAKEDLQIENILSVMQNHTRTVANYSFDRLNTDFQNLLVNKTGGSTFQSRLTGNTNIFGKKHGVKDNIERMLINILKYTDVNESEFIKVAKKVLRNTVRAVIGLAVPMYLKQYFSVITIWSKLPQQDRVSLVRILKGVTLSTRLNNKYYKWLMKNNNNFYFRAKVKFIPNLSEHASFQIFGSQNSLISKTLDGIDKVSEVLTTHVGRADARVLVGAFMAKAEQIRRRNPSLQEEEVLNKANDWLNKEVLLFGVANTNSAFRSNLSNSQAPLQMIAGKFQSENLIHYSSIMRGIYQIRNGATKVQVGRLGKDIFAYLMSGLLSSFVNKWWGELMEYDEDVKAEDELKDFIINEFFWDNLLGSIPYLNQFTQQIRIDFDTNNPLGFWFKEGFEPKMPLLDDFTRLSLDLVQIWDSEGNFRERKLYDALEELGHMIGFPIKNARKIAQIAGKTFGEYGSERGREVDRLFNNKTRTEAYYDAIKEGSRKEINEYVNDRFENVRVRNEIVSLLTKFPDERIKIYDVDTFRKMGEDGKYDTYSIPEKTNDKYRQLTQRALGRLIGRSGYRRLTDEHKIKTIQRVINYYYNYMKAVVVDDYDKISDMSSVINRAIDYAIRAMKDEKKRT